MWVTTEQAAAIAGVRPNTITKWVSRGYLRCHRRQKYSQRLGWHEVSCFDEREVLIVEHATRKRGAPARLDQPA